MISPARTIFYRLAQLARLAPDWDSYGAHPPTAEAIAVAYEVLFAVSRRYASDDDAVVGPSALAPLADGGVQLEWRGRRQEIEVEIDPQGRLGYLLIEGEGPGRRFTEGDDLSLAEISALIAGVLSSAHDA